MPSEALSDSGRHLSVVDLDVHEPGASSDSMLAEAIVHLVLAYEAIDQFSKSRLTPLGSTAFAAVCRNLCATLVAIDEYTELVWMDP